MARKTRSDIKVGNLEKKLGLGPGSLTNPDGSDARSDKKLGTLRADFEKVQQTPIKKPATAKKAPTAAKTNTVKKAGTAAKPSTASKKKPSPAVRAKAVSPDQKIAAKRVVKPSPKAPSRVVKKVRAAISKSVKK